MKRIAVLIVALMFVIVGCTSNLQNTDNLQKIDNWGSFTSEKAFSFDNEFYAVQKVIKDKEGVSAINVEIYSEKNDEMIFSFVPARAMDFWGICWEKDSYNIWIQSADIGIFCYVYENNEWILDKNAERPDYIKSKWD